MEDLTCSCSAGEEVTVNGVVKAISNETSGNGRSVILIFRMNYLYLDELFVFGFL